MPVIDVATNAITATIPVGKRPWNMALTPDGRKLHVACGRSKTVAVIDTVTLAKVAEIAVGELPWGVAIRQAQGHDHEHEDGGMMFAFRDVAG